MKQLVLSTFALLFAIHAFAQTEGSITYMRVMQLKIEAPEGMEEMFKNMPKERSAEKVLLYSGKKSIYQNPDDKIGSEDSMVSLGDENMTFKIDFQEPDEKLFLNLESSISLHQQDFMGKQFLVKGEPRKTDWKLGKGKKKIAGYVCMEATAMVSDTIPLTAWFTPQIPLSIGPNGYGGLPGMIMQIDQANGDLLITATKVDLTSPNVGLIVEPTKGKKVSKDQFKKIVDEKMKEMHAHSSSGGGATFITIKQ